MRHNHPIVKHPAGRRESSYFERSRPAGRCRFVERREVRRGRSPETGRSPFQATTTALSAKTARGWSTARQKQHTTRPLPKFP